MWIISLFHFLKSCLFLFFSVTDLFLCDVYFIVLHLASLFLHLQIHLLVVLLLVIYMFLASCSISGRVAARDVALLILVITSVVSCRTYSEVLREELLVFEIFQEILGHHHAHLFCLACRDSCCACYFLNWLNYDICYLVEQGGQGVFLNRRGFIKGTLVS